MRLVFTINRDDISPERLEEYKTALNELIGYDGEWVVESRTETAQKQPTSTETSVNETATDGAQ